MPRAAKRDELGTLSRGFLDPRSFVSRDGREFLAGEDVSVRRHQVWERTGGFCERMGCNRNISEETMHMHHVRHRSKGGAENLNNLEGLCGRCHKKCHSNRELMWSTNAS
jgi:hypothetical protein